MARVSPPPEEQAREALLERLETTVEFLEQIVANRVILADVSDDARRRLMKAVMMVRSPDSRTRRRLEKAVARNQRAARTKRDEGLLDETGIRALRRKPVVTTPNVFPPRQFEPHDRHAAVDAGAGVDGVAGGVVDGVVDGVVGGLVDGAADNEASAASAAAASPAAGPAAASGAETVEPQVCYVCKVKYTAVHHFYDQMCAPCGDFNFAKRNELADLRGRVALLTGGRVKIGYQAGLKLLRAGAQLIVTTRFPRDSANRYAQEPDFAEWADRLEIFGLDLRHTPSVEAFCRQLLSTRSRLDFIVNNACQTVRRPPEFYAHMMAGETAAVRDMPQHLRKLVGAYEGLRGYQMLPESSGGESEAALAQRIADVAGLTHAAQLSQVALLPEELRAQKDLFPEGQLDRDLQQVDLRGRNSWRLLLNEVSAVELLEVQLVNAVAPFIINARLKPLMLRTPERDKHIVNVSAVEGQFYRMFKTTRHPHTNMAKAALNMMTRTAAADYHADGIHMNSVDTGWVTDEDPAAIAARKTAELNFHPPLDIIDGAARIVDPIIAGFNSGTHVWGQFLKDYMPTDW